MLLSTILLVGCGSSDLAPVNGTVSYDGKPIAEGRIGFYPAEGRPAYGDIRDGRFELTTYEPGDGALIGSHRVTVHADVASNPDDAFSDRVPLIPARYQAPEKSGLTAEIHAGPNDVEFALTP